MLSPDCGPSGGGPACAGAAPPEGRKESSPESVVGGHVGRPRRGLIRTQLEQCLRSWTFAHHQDP
eukprot:15123072-Alexandrium_andersonii.AAC.1